MDTAYVPLIVVLAVLGLVAALALGVNLYRLYGDQLHHRSARIVCLTCGKKTRINRRSLLLGYLRCKRCSQKLLLPQASLHRQRNRF